MKRYIKCEIYNNHEYLFRGESNNDYQSNYSKKFKTRYKSRFFAYELFHGIQLFGNVAVYELLDSSKILDYDDSVEQFIEDYSLVSYEVPELQSIYKINSLSELSEYGGSVEFDYHDLYHARQLVAISYVEENLSSYSGIHWYEWDDEPSDQVMIWDDSILRKLKYNEAKQVLRGIEEMQKAVGITDTLYHKDEYFDDYNYQIAKK